MEKINFKSKFDKFHEQWSPKIIAEMNDYQFKLVKIKNPNQNFFSQATLNLS